MTWAGYDKLSVGLSCSSAYVPTHLHRAQFYAMTSCGLHSVHHQVFASAPLGRFHMLLRRRQNCSTDLRSSVSESHDKL